MQVVTVTPGLLAFFEARRIFHKGRWLVGQRLAFHDACALEPYAQIFEGVVLPLSMGAFTYSNAELELHVQVGRYGSIGRHVRWMGQPHPTDWVSTSPVFYDDALPATGHFRETYGVTAPAWPYEFGLRLVEVGHDVWIGDGAMIAPGVKIGDGAIVGARSLVLHDVPPYAIVVGQPARVLRYRLAEDLIPRMLEAQWWRYAPNVLQPLPMNDPERFLDALAEVRERRPQVLKPQPVTAAEILAAAEA
ncbi:CatB-related O-acetyltransferase [Phenylobacterium sp.]|jgi:acetyltransferase-like isoleucine patch superfamily enzyme|uniref:CatB-related O-acetyltransferase n=1 Tax=Phenylobacterium sp. TaxID=1871053 RepID=UPI0032C23C47